MDSSINDHIQCLRTKYTILKIYMPPMESGHLGIFKSKYNNAVGVISW